MTRKYRHIEDDFCKEAGIFARVSSEKQEKGASIDAQKESVYEYCKNKGLKIIKEFIITESTIRGERKQYKEMLKFVASRTKKTAIVVNCVDRLQRSYKDTPILDDLRKKGLIEVHFLKENLILSKDSRGIDILFWNMCVLMTNSYILSLYDNVRRSLEYNWSQGKWQSLAPIGYLNRHTDDGNNEAIIIVDPVRGPIIKHLFKEFAIGKHTLKTLWYLSKELGLYTKNKKKKGCFVSRNTLYDVLTNPFYHGLMCIKGEFYNHIYEPLINKELFDRVQAILTGNGNHNRNNTTEYAKTPYTFRGLIHCKECGCLITPEKKVKKNGNAYIYLRCGHPCKECHQGIVNENVIIEQLKKEVMDRISLPPKLQEIVKEKLTQELNDTSVFNKTMKTNITKQLNELKVKDDNLLDYYLEGGLPKETYEEKHKQIANQRAELEQTAEKYKNIDADMKKRVVQVMALANNISKLFDMATPTRRNELLQLLISNCQLNGSKLEYTINAPFNWLINSNNYTEWTTIVIEHLDDFECVKV